MTSPKFTQVEMMLAEALRDHYKTASKVPVVRVIYEKFIRPIAEEVRVQEAIVEELMGCMRGAEPSIDGADIALECACCDKPEGSIRRRNSINFFICDGCAVRLFELKIRTSQND